MREYTTKSIEVAKQKAKHYLYKAGIKSLTIDEIVNESYENEVFVFGKMNNLIYNQKRRDKIYLTETKICTQCKQIKAACEFYFRTDYRINCTYLIGKCKNCHKNNYEHKKENNSISK